MELDKDFNEFVELFLAHDVRFLIIGGYALAAHGLPRATGDLDTWVSADSDNAVKILAALEEFGFGDVGVTIADLARDDSVIQLGYPPYRIDIITTISGVDFEAAWTRRLMIDLNGKQVGFIGREDLITNKKSVGRPQDIADVQRLIGS